MNENLMDDKAIENNAHVFEWVNGWIWKKNESLS